MYESGFSFFTLLVILLASAVQSIFGVGVLLFGTPLLLLQYDKFIDILPILLPISISINILQVVKDHSHIDLPFYKKFVFITIPLVFFFLVAVLYMESTYNSAWIGVMVGGVLLIYSIKEYFRFASRLTRSFSRWENTWFFIMGVIHGLTNLGGSLLTAIAHNKDYTKATARVTIGVSYGTWAFVKIIVIFFAAVGLFQIPGVNPRDISINVNNFIYLILGVAVFLISDKFIYKRISEEVYNKIFSVFLFLSGFLLVSKSLRVLITG